MCMYDNTVYCADKLGVIKYDYNTCEIVCLCVLFNNNIMILEQYVVCVHVHSCTYMFLA